MLISKESFNKVLHTFDHSLEPWKCGWHLDVHRTAIVCADGKSIPLPSVRYKDDSPHAQPRRTHCAQRKQALHQPAAIDQTHANLGLSELTIRGTVELGLCSHLIDSCGHASMA
jgi:hypothetical protein